MAKKKINKKKSGLSTDLIFLNLPYILFLSFLGIIYIANTHAAERKMRDMQVLRKEIKEAKWEYINIQQKMMYGSTQSQLQKKLKDEEIKENRSVPEKIILGRS